MKFYRTVQICLLCLVLTGAYMFRRNKETVFNKHFMAIADKGIQIQNTSAGSICVQLMPVKVNAGGNAGAGVYSVLITLVRQQPVQQAALMHYMNFGIQKCFCAVQEHDTLPCSICERIPGIRGNEFSYIACFNKGIHTSSDLLRILITDTVAGFGTTAFGLKTRGTRLYHKR